MQNINPVKALRTELGLSQTEFGSKLGVSRDVINNIENNRVPLKPSLSKLICSQYNVDPYWLETGKGEMFMPLDEEDELLAYAAELITNKDLDWIRQLILTLMKMSPDELDVVEKFARSWLERMDKSEKEQE